MDTRPVEEILSEIGKAFRLCRLYPPAHPAVQQVLAGLAAALPGLAKSGAVDLRINPSGFALGATPLAQRNTQIQELAGLLYAQGHRALALEPGLGADEIAALIQFVGTTKGRMPTTEGIQVRFQHLRLDRHGAKGARSSAAAAPMRASADGLGLGTRRSTGAFRPDALPPELEARRLAAQVAGAAPDEAVRLLARLEMLAPDLIGHRDWGPLADVVLALACGAGRAESMVREAGARALRAAIPEAAVAGLLSRVTDGQVPGGERDTAAHALGVLGARPVGAVADVYIASDDDTRAVLGAVIRRAGEDAVEPILMKLDIDAEASHARGYAQLLGMTMSLQAVPALGQFALHGASEVRQAALESLERIGGSDVERILAATLRDEDPGVRARAARAAAWIGAPMLAPILLARLEEEEDDDAAIAFLAALGELREPRAVSTLEHFAEGVSGLFRRHPRDIRLAAVRALGAIGTTDAIEAVRRFAGHRQAELRAAAQEILHERGEGT